MPESAPVPRPASAGPRTLWSLSLRLAPPAGRWCAEVPTTPEGPRVRVLSCLARPDGTLLETVLLSGLGWRDAFERIRQTTGAGETELLVESERGATIQVRVPSCPLLGAASQAGVPPCFPFEIRGGRDLWFLVSRRASAEALLAALRAQNVDFTVVRSGPYRPPTNLTTRQRDVLAVAVDAGYYDYPRRIHLTELAHQIGVAKSTLSEMLMLIEREVVPRALDNESTLLPVPARTDGNGVRTGKPRSEGADA